MRKILAAIALLLAAAPALATPGSGWRQTAQTDTWFVESTPANMTQLRDALIWHYERNALDGLVKTSALPNIALVSTSGGSCIVGTSPACELSVSMTRTQGDAWIIAYATAACPSATTNAARAACADTGIRADMQAIWQQYNDATYDASKPATPTLP
jgi:hypothetical protein